MTFVLAFSAAENQKSHRLTASLCKGSCREAGEGLTLKRQKPQLSAFFQSRSLLPSRSARATFLSEEGNGDELHCNRKQKCRLSVLKIQIRVCFLCGRKAAATNCSVKKLCRAKSRNRAGKKNRKNRKTEKNRKEKTKTAEMRNPRRLQIEGGGDVFLFRCCKDVRESIPEMV